MTNNKYIYIYIYVYMYMYICICEATESGPEHAPPRAFPGTVSEGPQCQGHIRAV